MGKPHCRHRQRRKLDLLDPPGQHREPDPYRQCRHQRHRQCRRQFAAGQCRQQYAVQLVVNGQTIKVNAPGVLLDFGVGAGAFDDFNTYGSWGGLSSNGALRFRLVGSDLLDGGSGADTLRGGVGNDVYAVDNSGDTVEEAPNAGHDLVRSSVSYALADNVEDLNLTGTADSDATGNAGQNQLVGNNGANRLDGGQGRDCLVGGLGDDRYVVENPGDVTWENPTAGIDSVESSISWTLQANTENLTLTGSAAINGTGNADANSLRGNAASNTLNGNAGTDTLDGKAGTDLLLGGAGNDSYVFGRGYGSDTVRENDATPGNMDAAQFLAGIGADQLWFRHIDNNLEASIIGTTDSLTIESWYLGNQYHVEQFKTADNKLLLDSRVDLLVQAMAAFAPPAAGQTTLPPNYQDSLATVIAANWQ
ncbi:MAG: hypothetical protein IPK39_23230 [Sulfuritalea sp.]|nr:hypothetical protein [Sulfuritalea sp.]